MVASLLRKNWWRILFLFFAVCPENIIAQMARYSIAVAEHLPRQRRKEKKDYAFRRQFDEKPSIIPGCPLC